ncbi:hypothetical protein WUBG_01905 [Wuchereria bancrofti]|uniref:Uncharacterized protein n=1 Tax=Wuchereria bancrofti TaxID=6293 RepID=J9FC77_WUCBA|nr:hypothetical protein WUBG_01905 [Wuchereria bancrofti]
MALCRDIIFRLFSSFLWRVYNVYNILLLRQKLVNRKKEFIEKVLRSRRTILDRERGVFEPPPPLRSLFTQSCYWYDYPALQQRIIKLSRHLTVTTNNIDGPSGRGSMSSPIRKIEKRRGTIASSISRLPYQSNTQ